MAIKAWVLLNPSDNVVVVTQTDGLPKGYELNKSKGLKTETPVPHGHKVSIGLIEKGSAVVKFGHVIGVAKRDIKAGEHVHIHNTEMPPVELLRNAAEAHKKVYFQSLENTEATFMGYPRTSGRAGTRNYLVVAATVNCSASVVKAVCQKFSKSELKKKGIDGLVPITHGAGCAQAIGGLSYETLNKTIAGWIFHPNVVGAVVIGLGCEGTTFNSILEFQQRLHLKNSIPVESLGIQESGGTSKTIELGVAAVERVLAKLDSFSRTPIPVSQLGLALNCGGSDAFSSITANPALGVASDILVSKGGTVALAEIPECHGAEDLLLERASSSDVKRSLIETFDWWNKYSKRHSVSLNENLSPGNIAGGITTIIEKSLGAVAKAGHSALNEVVNYSEPFTKSGFILMNTPGFDPVSVTGLVAGGCNIVAFTTGRGSVYGCGIAPTIKIATTSELFQKMSGDMDFDAGTLLQSESLEQVGLNLYQLVVDVASGRETCSELLGMGHEEFVPWAIGETL